MARVFCETWGFLLAIVKIPTSRKEREKWGTRRTFYSQRSSRLLEVEVCEIHISLGQDVDGENALAGG